MHPHQQYPRGLARAPAWLQPEPAGRLQSVLRRRRFMPSIVAVEPGHCLLTEQGRNRMLQPNRLTAGF